jgi:GNAT superfamily N-acetyltransferase
VKIVELADLPDGLGPQIAALNWLDGDPPQDARQMRRLRRLGYPVSSYQALLAVENRQVLGKVETIVQPFVTPRGTEQIVWISGVETRPDSLRRGIARALLDQAHDRERRAGRDWAFLWTHRSWAAHLLYEKLGYRDVYSPPAALRRSKPARRRALPDGYEWRPARADQHELLEKLLSEASHGRLGFIPRYSGSFRLRFEAGWRQPAEFGLLYKEARPVGYAHAPSILYGRSATEVVVTHPRHGPAMLDAIEREAGSQWLVLSRTSFIPDHAGLFDRRGYATYHQSHGTMMAKPLHTGLRLDGPDSPLDVCQSPAFYFHAGDIF